MRLEQLPSLYSFGQSPAFPIFWIIAEAHEALIGLYIFQSLFAIGACHREFREIEERRGPTNTIVTLESTFFAGRQAEMWGWVSPSKIYSGEANCA